MSNKNMERKPRNRNSRSPTNRDYKKKIYALCEKVKYGDDNAERELSEELDKNTLATWAVKHWNKVQKSKGRNKSFKDSMKKRTKVKKQNYGNAFKPYQGGAPGLGKKS
ncbi:MAG: hypothetical protein ABW072_10365 [Sedimenticola sp.]